MLYIGLDVHSKWMTVAGLDPATGKCLRWDRVSNDQASVVELIEESMMAIDGLVETLGRATIEAVLLVSAGNVAVERGRGGGDRRTSSRVRTRG